MIASILLAVPLAVIWMMVTMSVSVESFIVGMLLGFAILLLLRSEHPSLQWRKLPDQLIAFVVYTVTLGRDVVMSSFDVAKRVLKSEMPLRPGIVAIATQDLNENEAIAAFSAHGITLTPGELVLDFEGSHTMFVHCLDVEASSQNGPGAQTKRLLLLRRIMGVQTNE
ncbi:MAG: Na+/H+ antiporter subunit E [Burkholderiales bacterium]|nr:Na+/H+ antiporter subunit E [Anaerolineae bacterium]